MNGEIGGEESGRRKEMVIKVRMDVLLLWKDGVLGLEA